MKRSMAARDRAWLESLFDAHAGALRAFAVRRVGVDDGDDIVAEVFVTAWRRRNEVPAESLPWLYQVCRNVILHHGRSSTRRDALTRAMHASAPSPVQSAEQSTRVLVDSVLDALDNTDAEIMRLAVWEQLEPAEIAQVLGIRPGAARNRLMRARRKAQLLFEEMSVESEPETSSPRVVSMVRRQS